MYSLRETVVCVQRSLASASGLSVQAVGWDHHEDKVRQVLFLFLLQVIQIQAAVLLISIHALITDMIEVHLNQLLSGSFLSRFPSIWAYNLQNYWLWNLHPCNSFTQCRNDNSKKKRKKCLFVWHVVSKSTNEMYVYSQSSEAKVESGNIKTIISTTAS